MTVKHPMQPMVEDARGTIRFKENKIVLHLLDSHPTVGLNELARLDFSAEDKQQFAQLIGYSVGGYCTLSYVDNVEYNIVQMVQADENVDKKDAEISALRSEIELLRGKLDAIGKICGYDD